MELQLPRRHQDLDVAGIGGSDYKLFLRLTVKLTMEN